MKQALVTGGTRGIGAGVVRALLARGWRVRATGVDPLEVADYLAAPPSPEVAASTLDVSDQEDVDALLASLERLDALVNCAGVIARDEELEIATFARIVEVNLVGTMRVCLAAREKLAAGGGAIVNTASMLAVFGAARVPAYAASKGGVVQLTKSLAAAWASEGIRVNAIAPGWIETPMTEALRAEPEREAAILARTPMGRWGRADEVGALAAWLVSDEASFVTGSVHHVDGGYAAV